MSETAPETEAVEEAAVERLLASWVNEGGQEPAAAAPETPKPTPPTTQKAAEPSGNPWEDPEAAKAEIERLRRENASSRTNAKAKAAEDAKAELAQTIGKALGLVKDEPVDPAALTEQLTKAQGEQRQAALELAIYRSTSDAAVANALLDSRSFLEKVAGIDPTDGTAIAAAVAEAVQNNPALGKRVPAPNPAQGTSGNGPTGAAQLSKADLERMSPEQIEQARKDGRLNDLLGIKS